jgi:hypothetical protein
VLFILLFHLGFVAGGLFSFLNAVRFISFDLMLPDLSLPLFIVVTYSCLLFFVCNFVIKEGGGEVVGGVSAFFFFFLALRGLRRRLGYWN